MSTDVMPSRPGTGLGEKTACSEDGLLSDSRKRTPRPRQSGSARLERTASRREQTMEGGKVLITQMSDEEEDGSTRPVTMATRRHDSSSSSEDEEEEVERVKRELHKYMAEEDIAADNGYDTDLDIDDNAWLRGDVEFDPSGAKDYIEECNRMGVIPASYFLRHVHDTRFTMKYHGLGPLGAKAISKPFEINTTIEIIDLEGNSIEGNGARHLARMLRENLYVTEVYLAENNLGGRGAKAVCDMLHDNNIIKVLDLSGNDLKDSDGEMFYKVLEKNSTLRKLYLRHNGFERQASQWFKDALSVNESLRVLDLSWNHFRLAGARHVAEGVKENYGLKILNLAMNGFGHEGAKAMGHALKHNQSLEDLDLSANRIPSEGAIEIAKGLKVNDVLQIIKLSCNPIPPNGSTPIIMAIQRNDNSKVGLIYMKDIMVTEEFDNIQQKITDSRPIQVIHAGVLCGREIRLPPPRKVNPEALFWNDPMTKLKRYADEIGFRLIDVFKQFDKDNSWSVSHEEFIQGVKAGGIPLTDEEIYVLINRLDADGDGEIDYKELSDGATQNRQFKFAVIGAKQEDPEYEDKERDPLDTDNEED